MIPVIMPIYMPHSGIELTIKNKYEFFGIYGASVFLILALLSMICSTIYIYNTLPGSSSNFEFFMELSTNYMIGSIVCVGIFFIGIFLPKEEGF